MTPLSDSEILKMKEVCKLAANLLVYLGKKVEPGVTTNQINDWAVQYTQAAGAKSAPLNYHGFPKSICTSVNHCICHGLPDDKPLLEGDIVNIDVTPVLDGFYGDTSATFFVGQVSDEARQIAEVAKEAMYKGIEVVSPFATTGDIGFAIGKYVTKKGYFPVEEIGGHGIGKVFHTDPFVPSVGKKGKGVRLVPWTCITVEPMINQTGKPISEISIPNSTIKYYETADKTYSAQFEHTVLVTDVGYEILTLPDSEN